MVLLYLNGICYSAKLISGLLGEFKEFKWLRDFCGVLKDYKKLNEGFVEVWWHVRNRYKFQGLPGEFRGSQRGVSGTFKRASDGFKGFSRHFNGFSGGYFRGLTRIFCKSEVCIVSQT